MTGTSSNGENSVSEPGQDKSRHPRAGKAGHGVLEPKWREEAVHCRCGVLESMRGEGGPQDSNTKGKGEASQWGTLAETTLTK